MGGFYVGFDRGVEASEGIVAGDIGISLLFDVVFVVFLADRIYSCKNVDHTHCCCSKRIRRLLRSEKSMWQCGVGRLLTPPSGSPSRREKEVISE